MEDASLNCRLTTNSLKFRSNLSFCLALAYIIWPTLNVSYYLEFVRALSRKIFLGFVKNLSLVF